MTQPMPDELILVDPQDNVVGYGPKLDSHLGEGVLHRAFSVLVFNRDRELLLQQRSNFKLLWPGYWSNTCCSHPGRDESVEQAAKRRLQEELGFSCPVRFLYKFQYEAAFEQVGSERELCHVMVGFCDDLPKPNPEEVANWRYLSAEQVDLELADNAGQYSPWFHLEWQHVRRHLWGELF